MQCLDDFRLSFKGREFLPLMVGGMGTNISTANLVLAIEKLGGMAHLSDAMLPDVADREIGTHFTKEKTIRFKSMIQEADKTEEKFNLEALSRVSKQYFADVMEGEEEYIEKAVEGLVLGFFNQGEVCTCPSRALIQESIYEPFMARVMEKVAQIRRGDPFDTDTMIGAQASRQQFDKILSYIKIARDEGGKILTGGERASISAELDNGFYIQPTLIQGRNDMRSFQEEIFGPVIGVTTFKDEAEALAIANETQFGLGAGVWTRDTNLAYRMGRGIKAGRVWTNCYHVYPAHAAFGGYKQSGVGRETHKMALDAYQQTKNLLVSYGTAPLGLF